MKDEKMWVWFGFSFVLVEGGLASNTWTNERVYQQAKVATRREALFGSERFVLSMCVSGRAAEVVTLLVPSMRIDGVG